jgi:hypothetical protein
VCERSTIPSTTKASLGHITRGAYDAAAHPMNALDVLIGQTYCKICNFEAYASSIMANPTQCLSLSR